MTSLDIIRNLVRSQTMSGDYSNAIRSRGSGLAGDTNYSMRQSAPTGSLPETSPPAFKAWNIPNSGARRDYSADPQFMEFPHLTRAANAIANAAHEYGNTFVRNRLASERIRQADARQEGRRARAAELEEQRASTAEEREMLAQGRRTRQIEAHERLNQREARLSERERRLQEQEARLQARDAARNTGTAAKDDADSGPAIPPQGGLGNVTGAGMVTSPQPSGQGSSAAPQTATPSASSEFDDETARIRQETLTQFYPGSSVRSSTDKRRGNAPQGEV